MANNKKPIRGDAWKERIQTSMLVNRLNDNALNVLDVEMTQGQIASAKILLSKTIPDLKAIEHTGKDGGKIEQSLTVEYVGADK